MAHRHGPYLQWTERRHGRTVTRLLRPREAALVRDWIANARRLDAAIRRLQAISERATEVILQETGT